MRPVWRPAGASRRYQTWALNHILGIGQSLAVGGYGTPVLSSSQPYTNLMFDAPRAVTLTSTNALIEATDGIYGETIASGMANLVTSLHASHRALASIAGLGASAYVDLKQGTATYDAGLDQVTAGVARAVAMGLSYGVSAIANVHGETDADINNVSYNDDLEEWQSDFETDIKAITGQSGTIPMLVSQCSSAGANNDVPLAQLRAHVANPGKIILVGPKYHLPTTDPGVDDRHLSNEGYRQLGEDFAKVYKRAIIDGLTWEPLRPRQVSRVGAVITVQFHVPVAPLVLDTTLVTAQTDMGFAWSGSETIDDVSIVDPDNGTIEITLSGPETGTLTYAQGASMKGNLRDSDATASLNGYDLYNWCCHFSEAVS